MARPSALEKALLQAAEIAEKHGLSLDTEPILHHDEIQEQKETAKRMHSNALEVIINQMHHKHATEMKICKWCKGKFYTTYCYHQYCSDECRTAEFESRFQIHPGLLKPPASFWEYEEIGVVSVEMTEKLYGWAKEVVRQFECLTDQERQEVPSGDEEPSIDDPLATEQSPETQTTYVSESSDDPQATLQSTLDILDSISFDF